MVKGKKITKKKLKEPDEFITLTQKSFLFITQHRKEIGIGGIVIFLLLLSIFTFRWWERKKEKEAYLKFTPAVEVYQLAISPYREFESTKFKPLLVLFDEVLTKFPDTSSGKLSHLYKGHLYLHLSEFDEAIKSYQTFLEKWRGEKLFKILAWEGLGYAFEGKRDFEKALEAYQRVLELGEGTPFARAHLNKGRCYEKLGKKKEASESYRAFLKLSEKSNWTPLVLRKISLLEKGS